MGDVSKTTVTVELANGGWARQAIDLIEHDGGIWLVPRWLPSPDGRTRQPLRLISMTMADTGGPASDPDCFEGLPIPESVLSEGHVPLSLSRLFLVIETPDLWLPAPGPGPATSR